MTNNDSLQVNDLHVAYGKTPALHGISLEVAKGEMVSLIGANGAGKTTTLRAISGLLKPSSGSITWDGTSVGGLDAERIVSMAVAHCPEERHIWPGMTVRENLMLGAFLLKSTSLVEERMDNVLDRFPKLRERLKQIAGTLSGGEQQMLAIGRALMSEPKLLMLDEPSLGLSPKMVADVFDVIRDINSNGVSVLLVEQNVHNALELTSRAYVMETGTIVAQASSTELLDDPKLKRAYLGA